MADTPSREAARQLLGCADSELVEILDSPAGPVFVMADGTHYINVPADRPDFNGKTGLMFASAPVVNNQYGWVGDFPVYANAPAEITAEIATRDLTDADLEAKSKEELLDQARDLGIDADGRWGHKRLVEAITARLTAVTESTVES